MKREQGNKRAMQLKVKSISSASLSCFCRRIALVVEEGVGGGGGGKGSERKSQMERNSISLFPSRKRERIDLVLLI